MTPEKPKRRKKSSKRQPNNILSAWPLLLIIPLIGFLCLAPLHRVVGGIGSCCAFIIFMTATILAYLTAKREGLTTMDEMPWFVRNIPIFFVFMVFRWAFQRPLVIGPWVAVAVFGFISMVASATISEGKNAWESKAPLPVRDARPLENPKSDFDTLLADLDAQDARAVRQAAEGLAKIQPNERQAEVANKLMKVVSGNNLFAREAAFKGLAAWMTPGQVPELIALTGRKEVDVRRGAIELLGRVPDERAYKALAGGLRDIFTRDEAKKALLRVGPVAENEVRGILNDKDQITQQAAIQVLAQIGTAQSVPALEAIAQRKSPIERFNSKEAANAISSINARAKKG